MLRYPVLPHRLVSPSSQYGPTGLKGMGEAQKGDHGKLTALISEKLLTHAMTISPHRPGTAYTR